MAKQTVRKTLPRATWVKIFAKADVRYPTGQRDRAMYYFAYYTGLRVGELVNLRYRDVDLASGKFTTPPEGKTGQRKLALPDSAKLLALIDRWLGVREAWCADSPYFFCTENGNPVDADNFAKVLSRRAIAAGIEERVTPHMMRHSYATERIYEGTTLLDLMSELGHKNIRTTMIYLHQENVRAVDNMRSRSVS